MTIDMQMIFENRMRHNCLYVINYYNEPLYENVFVYVTFSLWGSFNLTFISTLFINFLYNKLINF